MEPGSNPVGKENPGHAEKSHREATWRVWMAAQVEVQPAASHNSQVHKGRYPYRGPAPLRLGLFLAEVLDMVGLRCAVFVPYLNSWPSSETMSKNAMIVELFKLQSVVVCNAAMEKLTQ